MQTNTLQEEMKNRLLEQKDNKYADFQRKLIPNIEADTIIGVRTPELRKLAKEFSKREEITGFLTDLPHASFEENQLHAFILSLEKDFSHLMPALENFLPYVDNWATCDQLSPKIFKKYHDKLLPFIENWLKSEHTYTIRFGIGMLMQHYLCEDFSLRFPELVADVHSEEYYVNMMIAWYFATALAKQYEKILPYIEEKRLDKWTHNKTIQKAVESCRITPEQKDYLRTLKVR